MVPLTSMVKSAPFFASNTPQSKLPFAEGLSPLRYPTTPENNKPSHFISFIAQLKSGENSQRSLLVSSVNGYEKHDTVALCFFSLQLFYSSSDRISAIISFLVVIASKNSSYARYFPWSNSLNSACAFCNVPYRSEKTWNKSIKNVCIRLPYRSHSSGSPLSYTLPLQLYGVPFCHTIRYYFLNFALFSDKNPLSSSVQRFSQFPI